MMQHTKIMTRLNGFVSSSRSRGRRSLSSRVTIPDNFSPFRWMGCSIAVYGTTFRAKAECRVEKILCPLVRRTRRGKKKDRGGGSRERRTAERACQRAARASAPPSMPGILARMEKARVMIDNLHDRSRRFGTRLSLRRVGFERCYEEVREKMVTEGRTSQGLKNAEDRIWKSIQSTRKREVTLFSRLWGIPKNVTRLRISKLAVGAGFNAIPRLTVEALIRSGSPLVDVTEDGYTAAEAMDCALKNRSLFGLASADRRKKLLEAYRPRRIDRSLRASAGPVASRATGNRPRERKQPPRAPRGRR